MNSQISQTSQIILALAATLALCAGAAYAVWLDERERQEEEAFLKMLQADAIEAFDEAWAEKREREKETACQGSTSSS